MKNYVIASIVVIALTAGAAQAQDRDPYAPLDAFTLSLLGGWATHPALAVSGTHQEMGDGFNVGARLGYKLDGLMSMPGFSLDADYFYNQSDYKGTGAQLGSQSFMGDLTYHIPTNSPWGVYGGAGLGGVQDNLYGTLHGTSTVFGWQALGGAEYQFTPTTAMFAEYRYQNAHDANLGANGLVGNTSNNLSVGVKFKL